MPNFINVDYALKMLEHEKNKRKRPHAVEVYSDTWVKNFLKSLPTTKVPDKNEQTLKIERLRQRNNQYHNKIQNQKAELTRLNEQVLKLESLLDGARYEFNCLKLSAQNTSEDLKAEKEQAWFDGYYFGWYKATKEFIKKLKTKAKVKIYCDNTLPKPHKTYYIEEDAIDNLGKEMMK